MASPPTITLLEKIIDARLGYMRLHGYYPNAIIMSADNYNVLEAELISRYEFGDPPGKPTMVMGMEILLAMKLGVFKVVRLEEGTNVS